MTFDLPWPPTVNHYWRMVGNRVLISKRGREYRDAVTALIWQLGLRHQLNCRLAVLIEAYPPDRRQRDLDNITKSLLDSLTHAGAYRDDSLIDDLRIVRCPVIAEGKVTITITQKEVPSE